MKIKYREGPFHFLQSLRDEWVSEYILYFVFRFFLLHTGGGGGLREKLS